MSSCTIRVITAVTCAASQSTSFHTNDSLTGNFRFASATAREIAPADARPSAQELAVGKSTAKWSTAEAASDRAQAKHAHKSRRFDYPDPEKEGSTGQDIESRRRLFANT
jgi:hypothetical protein